MKVIGVTLGWDGNPTTVDEGGFVHVRRAEDIFHPEYYPDGSKTWPRDPETGDKLPIWEYKAPPSNSWLARSWRWLWGQS